MANTTLQVDTLNALTGRLLSHTDELAGRPDLPPGLAEDVAVATEIAGLVSHFLAGLVGVMPPPTLPEAGRSSHYSG
jgi:hypothetical protein